jgi:choline kinase
MKGVVIAAGRGRRMQAYTADKPKCMLDVAGRPLLAHALAALRRAGCHEITVVTGYRADRVVAPGCRIVCNTDYERNNILHSLMYARDSFDDDVLVTYSDIFVEPDIHERLANASGDIVLAVDRDWQAYYEQRAHHPLEEAEKAFIVERAPHRGDVVAIGKDLTLEDAGTHLCGEFLGLWKMTADGARRFRDRFERLDATLSSEDPFQAARTWRQAYVTDLFADLLAAGAPVHAELIERGWVEIDGAEDYERLPATITTQRLRTLQGTV